MSAIVQIGSQTKAILRPASVICIKFDVTRKFIYLGAVFSGKKMRNDLELPEENHIFVTMESEYSSLGPRIKMGLDCCHQVPIEVQLRILTVDVD